MANNDEVGELQEKVISDQVNMTDISPATTEDIFSEYGTIRHLVYHSRDGGRILDCVEDYLLNILS